MSDTYDCVVLGNGRIALTIATVVAQAGYRTLLAGPEQPRCPQSGDVVPVVCRPLLAQLGMDLSAGEFAAEPRRLRFVDHLGRPLDDHRSPGSANEQRATLANTENAWLMRSADFCRRLRQTAEQQGVHICWVSGELQTAPQSTGRHEVRFTTAEGTSRTVAARLVLDLSRREPFATENVNADNPSDTKSSTRGAIWGHYQRVGPPAAGVPEGPLVLRTAERDCWFWIVPLTGEVTSVGVVGPCEQTLDDHPGAATAFEELLTACPAALHRLIDAELVGPLHVQCDTFPVQFQAEQGVLRLRGEPSRLDPLYGSKLLTGLAFGQLLGRTAVESLAAGDLSAGRLGKGQTPFFETAERVAHFVDRLYAAEASDEPRAVLFTQYLAASSSLLTVAKGGSAERTAAVS